MVLLLLWQRRLRQHATLDGQQVKQAGLRVMRYVSTREVIISDCINQSYQSRQRPRAAVQVCDWYHTHTGSVRTGSTYQGAVTFTCLKSHQSCFCHIEYFNQRNMQISPISQNQRYTNRIFQCRSGYTSVITLIRIYAYRRCLWVG